MLAVLSYVLPLLLSLLSFPAVQPIALIMKIEASWNDLPLLVKQMENVNGTHRITQCENAIAHYSKIKGYHCRRRAELTFCIVTWWWFNQLLSFTSHPGACRFRRCRWMKKSRGSVGEEKKRKAGEKKTCLSLWVFFFRRIMQIFQSNKASRKKLHQIEVSKRVKMSGDIFKEQTPLMPNEE